MSPPLVLLVIFHSGVSAPTVRVRLTCNHQSVPHFLGEDESQLGKSPAFIVEATDGESRKLDFPSETWKRPEERLGVPAGKLMHELTLEECEPLAPDLLWSGAEEPVPVCFQGSLDDFSIQDVLQIISQGRKTGWLSVDTPSGGGAIVFGQGRVLASIDDDAPPVDAGRAPAPGGLRDALIRERIAASLHRVARARHGEFSFQVSTQPPRAIGGRDIAGETLRSGVDVIDLLIDIASRQEQAEPPAPRDARGPARGKGDA